MFSLKVGCLWSSFKAIYLKNDSIGIIRFVSLLACFGPRAWMPVRQWNHVSTVAFK